MTEVRLLAADEYGRLSAVPETHRASIGPDNTLVAAAFDGERLVGVLALINLPHLECAWIHPEHRGGTLFWRLEALLLEELKRLGAKAVLAFAVDSRMEDYCLRGGYRKIATAWIKEI